MAAQKPDSGWLCATRSSAVTVNVPPPPGFTLAVSYGFPTFQIPGRLITPGLVLCAMAGAASLRVGCRGARLVSADAAMALGQILIA